MVGISVRLSPWPLWWKLYISLRLFLTFRQRVVSTTAATTATITPTIMYIYRDELSSGGGGSPWVVWVPLVVVELLSVELLV
jgi:hypothetical protein